MKRHRKESPGDSQVFKEEDSKKWKKTRECAGNGRTPPQRKKGATVCNKEQEGSRKESWTQTAEMESIPSLARGRRHLFPLSQALLRRPTRHSPAQAVSPKFFPSRGLPASSGHAPGPGNATYWPFPFFNRSYCHTACLYLNHYTAKEWWCSKKLF